MLPPSPQQPIQARSRKTQQNLVDALERLLSSKSIGELTVAEIAAQAGVTTGAIYRRFKDKQDLLRAAFDRFLEKTEENGARLMLEGAELGNRELLKLVIEGTLHFTLQHLDIMRAASALNDMPSFERMRSARNLTADIVAERLVTSALPVGVLKHRVRFTLRLVTAVVRDTFLAGPGAHGIDSSVDNYLDEHKDAMDQLVSDLMETSVPYLQI